MIIQHTASLWNYIWKNFQTEESYKQTRETFRILGGKNKSQETFECSLSNTNGGKMMNGNILFSTVSAVKAM